jgi:hypothetical protein
MTSARRKRFSSTKRVQNPPRSETVSNQGSTISSAPKTQSAAPEAQAVPARPHPRWQFLRLDKQFCFYNTDQPFSLSTTSTERVPEVPGGPRSPRGTVGPSGSPNPPTIRTQGPRPAPCLLFRPSVMTTVTSLLTYKVDLSNRPSSEFQLTAFNRKAFASHCP